MNKKFLITILCLFGIQSAAYCHSGRIDSNGGHRVNKEKSYAGVYIIVTNGSPMVREGRVDFNPGDYHYHVHPRTNGFLEGTYIASGAKNSVATENTFVSLESVLSSKESDVYHNIWSGYAKRMKDENVIIFESHEDAKESGYRASRYFKPYQEGVTKLSKKDKKFMKDIGLDVDSFFAGGN